ncbi:MAG: hypothetical protein HY553_03650 [Elusimicrobia bacterium]|nr:hypothetical protein [Elusimicrobiota bacterium]
MTDEIQQPEPQAEPQSEREATPAEIEEYQRDVRQYGRERADEMWRNASARASTDPHYGQLVAQFKDHVLARLTEEGLEREEVAEFLQSERGKKLAAQFQAYAKDAKTPFQWTSALEKAIKDVRYLRSRGFLEMSPDEQAVVVKKAKDRAEARDRRAKEMHAAQDRERRAAIIRGDPDHRSPSILALSPEDWEKFQKQVR